MIYFSSDWHLGHSNILKYDNRPFKTIDEMDNAIILNATSILGKGDTLYYIGDFCFTKDNNTAEGHMKALALTGADLIFIRGNHDNKIIRKLYSKYGIYLGEQFMISCYDQDIVLNHYAMRVWNKSHNGSWHLYGHSHDTLEYEAWGKSMDVGVQSAYRIKGEYTLFSFEDIKSILSTRSQKIIDHHGKTGRL